VVLFDQLDLDAERDRQNKPGKSGTGTKIDRATRQWSGDGAKLQTVFNVARPELWQIGGAGQIDGGVPLAQQIGVGVQSRLRLRARRLANLDHVGMIDGTIVTRNRMTIVFIGDIHQHWHYVDAGLAALTAQPGYAVLLGDIQCDRPLDELAAPLLDRGVVVHWIHGNHDNDGGPEMWANLAAPERNPSTASGSLHARVVDIDGVRIAGLGGTFRPRVWAPPSAARLRHRHQLEDDLRSLGPAYGPRQRAALAHSLTTAAIWPEDIEALASQKADILVTHEAPSSHPSGSAVIDELARAMGVRMIVHGHHHVASYARARDVSRARAGDGLTVLGVASAWGISITGEVLWKGEKPRPLPAPSGADWVVQSIAA
jgi:predicted phosphodiesterase